MVRGFRVSWNKVPAGTGTPRATATETGTRDSPLPSKIAFRTAAQFPGNVPSGDHTTGSGYLSQVHTQLSANVQHRGRSPKSKAQYASGTQGGLRGIP